MGNLRDLIDFAESEQGIRWGFAEDQLGVGLHGLLHVLYFPEIDKGELHAERCEELATAPVRATVGALGDYAVVASLHGGTDAGRSGSHPCAKRSCTEPILQNCKLLLKGANSRVVCPRIAEALCEIRLNGFLDESCRQDERRQNCSCLLFRRDSSVNKLGVIRKGPSHPSASFGVLGSVGDWTTRSVPRHS